MVYLNLEAEPMAPLSTQGPSESSEAAYSAPPTNQASTESAGSSSSQNAKIQEQVKVVINDLAKKMHGKWAFIILLVLRDMYN